MTTFLTILGLGFLLGLRHATDADHVVAISAITARQRNIKDSALIGALWGIGHSAMVTLIGVLIIFFSLKIPPQVEMTLEFSVGIMLVILGVMNIFYLRKQTLENLAPKKSQTMRPLLIGLVHGLAGSAAIALLILATIKNPNEAAFYLLVFNIGVIVGMMIITTLIGTSFAYAKKKINNLHNYLVLGSGIISIIFGLYIMHQNKF